MGINVDSDDYVSLFSNLSVKHYDYFGYHLLRTVATHVTVHTLVKVIDQHAFMNCIKLKRIELPNILEVIKEYAFQGCVELRTIILPGGALYIETGAFDGCSSLECVVIPSTVNYFGTYAF